MLVIFTIFFYRYMKPFATFTPPQKLSTARIIEYVHLGVLGFASVGIPLAMPRQYVPVDPEVRVFKLSGYIVHTTKNLTDIRIL